MACLLVSVAAASCTAAAAETPPTPRIEAAAGAPLQPGQAFAVLPPWFPAPKPPRLPALRQLQISPWFPALKLSASPRVLPSERLHAVPLRPMPDTAAGSGLPVPDPRFAIENQKSKIPPLPSGAVARAASPDSGSTRTVLAGPVPNRSLPPSSAWIPRAGAAQAPRRVPMDGSHPLYPRPALDRPEVALTPKSVVLALPRMPTADLAFAYAVDPARVPLRSASFLPIPERATATTDPTLDWARRAAGTYVSWLRVTPAPFLKLTIPDPFETLTVVQLRTAWPDAEPPAISPTLPSRRTFPPPPK